jgi:hypothetical protein
LILRSERRIVGNVKETTMNFELTVMQGIYLGMAGVLFLLALAFPKPMRDAEQWADIRDERPKGRRR